MDKQELIDFELKVKALWEEGKIKAPVHFCGGNEDQLIEIFKEVNRADYVFSGHRNHYHCLLHGVPGDALLREILGDPGATCGGRGRSMGFIDSSHRVYCSAIVGGCVNIAVGTAWALARQLKQDPLGVDEHAARRHVWCFVGDGAVDGGHFWEALQYAQGWDLPITFVVEDNDRATCTSWVARSGPKAFMGKCIAYGPGMYKVRYYYYKPTYPHVGSGTYVQF